MSYQSIQQSATVKSRQSLVIYDQPSNATTELEIRLESEAALEYLMILGVNDSPVTRRFIVGQGALLRLRYLVIGAGQRQLSFYHRLDERSQLDSRSLILSAQGAEQVEDRKRNLPFWQAPFECPSKCPRSLVEKEVGSRV